MKTIDDLNKENIFVENFSGYVSFRCPVITLYNQDTLDCKGFYVARLFECKEGKSYPTKVICVNKDLKKVKEAIPEWMVFFIRSEDDDKCIIGSYI